MCTRLCKALVFVVGATACSASRIVGDSHVEPAKYALREVALGDEAAYRIADFPLTADVLATGELRTGVVRRMSESIPQRRSSCVISG